MHLGHSLLAIPCGSCDGLGAQFLAELVVIDGCAEIATKANFANLSLICQNQGWQKLFEQQKKKPATVQPSLSWTWLQSHSTLAGGSSRASS